MKLMTSALALTAMLIALAPPAGAQLPYQRGESYSTIRSAPTNTSLLRPKVHAGYQYGYFHYNEPGLMREFGGFHGVNAGFSIPAGENEYQLSAELEVLGAQLTYDGAYQDGTPVKSTTTDYMQTLRGLAGMNIFTSSSLLFTPYGGLGVRYLYDSIHGPGGYQREITYLFVPLGFETTIEAAVGWNLGLLAEYNVFLAGRVKSHLSDVDDSYPDVENTQNSGGGYRLALSSAHDMGSFGVKVQPYYHRWNVEKSDYVHSSADGKYYYEPANDTSMTGVNVLITY